MRILKRIAVTIALAYVVLTISLVACQRALIFLPSPEGQRSPADFGVQFEPAAIELRAGNTIKGWWIPATPEASTANRTTLVYFHGNGGNLSSRAHVAPLFHSLGWSTLMMSYRGFGASSGDGPTENSVYEDAAAMLDYARKQSPEDKLIVWGHSLGAAVAAHIGSNPTVDGVVLENPFTSVIDMARVRYPILPIREWMLLDRFPVIEAVTSIKAPLLALVAEHDTIIPPRMGEAVFNAAHEPKTRRVLRGIDHNQLPEAFEQHKQFVADWAKALPVR